MLHHTTKQTHPPAAKHTAHSPHTFPTTPFTQRHTTQHTLHPTIQDKYNLLYQWKRPPLLDSTLARRARNFLVVGVAVHVIMARVFFAVSKVDAWTHIPT